MHVELNRRQIEARRNAVVLLIVLGMLSLFSVLIVSYVVFSSQMRQTAYGNSVRRDRALDEQPIAESIIRQIVTGGGEKSAAFGADLLGDLYGVDHIRTRVAHRRPTEPFVFGDTNGNLDSRAMLLRPLDAKSNPQTTLFKIPLHFAAWHDDGPVGTSSFAQQLSNEVVSLVNFSSPTYEDDLRLLNLPNYRLNDVFSGRLLTFVDGPLAGNTFRIVRSFGAIPAGGAPPADVALAGCIVIDLAEAKSQTVSIDGVSSNLFAVADKTPNALVYSSGTDNQPGFSIFPLGFTPPSFHGQPYSDDIGYRLLINGSPFNGFGSNASGATELTRVNPASATQPFLIDPQFGPELMPNRRITGPILQPTQFDEPYDAADFDNWFLAWQPSDHRAILPGLASQLAALTGLSAADAQRAAPSIVPSFHRPEVINYIMSQPVIINGLGRTFSQMDGTDVDDVARLQLLVRRLRAASFRPLNFEHLFVRATEDTSLLTTNPLRKLYSDLDGDGNRFDGAPAFTGSNPTPILNEPIPVNGTILFKTLHANIRQLATWMCNGPWDIDNDGDAIPDSLWVDFDLPTQVVANGTVVRPLVAALIEDLDGRVNINVSGNYAQITSGRFLNNNATTYSTDAEYFGVRDSLGVFNRGGGVGPAEINFSHLFDEYRPSDPGNAIPPLFYSQTSFADSRVLFTRYGNVLQSRYGGTPWDYRSSLSAATFPLAHPGENAGSSNLRFSDPFSRMLHPARRYIHAADSPLGRPLDLYGRSMIRKAGGGNATMDTVNKPVPASSTTVSTVLSNEIENQPYEFQVDSPVADDKPFTGAEFHSLVTRGSATSLTSRLTTLLGDAADSNEALARLLTFDSRSLDSVELLPGGLTMAEYILRRMPPAIRSDQDQANLQLERMLGVEFRKGAKLNLNRPLGNGRDDNSNGLLDERTETAQATPDAVSPEPAFPWLSRDIQTDTVVSSSLAFQASASADYLPITNEVTFNPTGAELLARNLYCLMFRLILDPAVTDPSMDTTVELVPSFPYPPGIANDPTPDVQFRNRYVARRLAQWAVNVVDMRDSDAVMTRFRYDYNPFDADGFDLTVAAANVVWGMERPEIELTETLAFHDRRVKRNLATPLEPMDPTRTLDGESPNDEPPGPLMPGDPDPDQEMDQFRIPEASAFVELHTLREPYVNDGSLESYPAELYDFTSGAPLLDLGKVTSDGSPVWRLAVGYTANTAGAFSPDPQGYRRSVLWTNDAERFSSLGAGLPDPFFRYMVDTDDFTAGDNDNAWYSRVRPTAEIIHPVGTNAAVSLYYDDFDGMTDAPPSVPLTRFVWFSGAAPTAASNVIVNSAESGMRLDNVFYRSAVLGSAVNVQLPGDSYAVVAPRDVTILGQTEESSVGTSFGYYPSDQRFEFAVSGTGHTLRIFDLNNNRVTPDYLVDNGTDYRAKNIYPIVAASLPPHEADTFPVPYLGPNVAIDPNRVINSWKRFFDHADAGGDGLGVAPALRIGAGFNISAPLSGSNYYLAPTKRINTMAPVYPKFDGYRDYNNASLTLDNLHPDVPLDERPGAPLFDLGLLQAGNHQDVANIFLQRLADPTQPWNAVSNPYLTVDAMTMDLTVFNGEERLDQFIDRDGDGMATAIEPVDLNTPTYPTQMAFDTRRKVPDPSMDRPASQLVPKTANFTPAYLNDLNNYDRFVYATRSPLMTQQSVLRNDVERGPTAPGVRPHFRHQLMSAWNNGTAAMGPTSTVHSGFKYDAMRQRFDVPTERYPQTLGFVNRETGEPAQAGTVFAGASSSGVTGNYVGHPIAVAWQMPTWLDRPFQSIYELMSVPATSSYRLTQEYSMGTTYDPTNSRETPAGFGYLLGFEQKLGERRGGTEAADIRSLPADLVTGDPILGLNRDLTGARAGFEQIFDMVDIGPLSFEQRRWLDPTQTQRVAVGSVRDGMFNQVVRTLQPPFNYIDRHRTPGKINLNTAPDYVRQGGNFATRFPVTAPEFQNPLTAGTAPQTPAATGGGLLTGIASEPTNYRIGMTADPYNTAILYGNGSVYRSLTGGISTAYDFDDVPGEPAVLGQYNGYKQSIDSRFGHGFKNFVQSRRGYTSSLLNRAESWSQLHFFNIDLDYRYPSRFAGMFAPNFAATLPSAQRYLRTGTADSAESTVRRAHDMAMLRVNPDFDLRVMSAVNQAAAVNPASTDYTLLAEQAPTAGVTLPPLSYLSNSAGTTDSQPVAGVTNHRVVLVGMGVLERPQIELHKNYRNLDHDPFFRFKNASHLSGMTTHHSNVFMIRYTVGFFVVDTLTGAVGEEYLDPRTGYVRPRGFHLVDRSIPVGYEANDGISAQRQFNSLDTVIFSSTE